MELDEFVVHEGTTGVRLRFKGVMTYEFAQLDWPSGEVRSTVRLPYPGSGVEGAVLSISPGRRYAAALLYSGQASLGYELFRLDPTLERCGSLPYTGGTSDLTAVRFSPDETLAAMIMQEGSLWWIDPEAWEDDSDVEQDHSTPAAEGRAHWATLFVHRLGEDRPTEILVVVDLPEGWWPGSDETVPENLRFETPTWLSWDVPWLGRFATQIPRDDETIVVPVLPT